MHRLLILLATAVFLVPDLHAQIRRWLPPDTLAPMRRLYNVDSNEFIIGAWIGADGVDDGGRVTDQWRVAASLGIDVIVPFLYARDPLSALYAQIDSLADDTARGDRRMIVELSPIKDIGGLDIWKGGQGVEIYPFDSSQSPHMRWVFERIAVDKGRLQRNGWYRRDPSAGIDRSLWPWKAYGPTERAYSEPRDTGLLFEGPAFLDPNPAASSAGRGERPDATRFLEHVYDNASGDEATFDLHTVLIGRFIDDPARPVAATDTIFVVKLFHQIPRGSRYRADDGIVRTASNMISVAIDSFVVTKADLLRGAPVTDPEAYREIAHRTDLRYRFNDTNRIGIYHPSQIRLRDGGSNKLDVKVYRRGRGAAAVRAIALRNPRAELALGQSERSVAYRQAIVDSARHITYGVDSLGITKQGVPARDAVLRIETGHEPFQFGATPWQAVDRLLRDSLIVNDGRDTLHSGIVDLYNTVALDWHAIANDPILELETYTNRRRLFDDLLNEGLSLPHPVMLPSIREHNGGRFGIPELSLSRGDVERYSETVQRGLFGWYAPEAGVYTPHHPYTLEMMGLGARLGRSRGVHLWPILGVTSLLRLEPVGIETRRRDGRDELVSYRMDTILSHIREPAELRALGNLAIAYGATGIFYWTLASDLKPIGRERMIFPAGPDTIWYGQQDDLGIIGETYADTTRDLYESFELRSISVPGRPLGSIRYAIPNFWVGWKIRSAELRAQNVWLKSIGGEIRRRGLRWRDGYSLHHQARRPGSSDFDERFPGTRTLRRDEIVTRVRSRHPVTGVVDSAWATYVELGLFHTKPGREGDPLLDTNYVFVVNRRTFERTADIDPETPRGRLMDTLTESRVIRLDLGLIARYAGPGIAQPEVNVRVREILPDTTPLPLFGSRAPLDTVVPADGSVEFLLGPGRAALLEIVSTDEHR